jgi:nitrate reductase NapD
MTDEISICGVLVHARPAQVQEVEARLAAMPGVEIHGCTKDGRLVVTVEEVGEHSCIDTLANMHEVAGVLSASLVYQHSE